MISVLDKGFVRHIESWGHGESGFVNYDFHDVDSELMTIDHECGIIEAARQSTQGSFRGWDQDKKLLAHLYNNNHATPFEFAGMVIEVKAPIMVFREWHRHRTQSYNEMSARYAPLPDENYVPTVERLMHVNTTNKQAMGTGATLTDGNAKSFQHNLIVMYMKAEELYQEALADGVPKELARLVLPVGRYTQMRVSANLRNWLSFMTLRCDPMAQWEIREYANAVAKIIQQEFPQTYALWEAKK